MSTLVEAVARIVDREAWSRWDAGEEGSLTMRLNKEGSLQRADVAMSTVLARAADLVRDAAESPAEQERFMALARRVYALGGSQ